MNKYIAQLTKTMGGKATNTFNPALYAWLLSIQEIHSTFYTDVFSTQSLSARGTSHIEWKGKRLYHGRLILCPLRLLRIDFVAASLYDDVKSLFNVQDNVQPGFHTLKSIALGFTSINKFLYIHLNLERYSTLAIIGGDENMNVIGYSCDDMR